MLFSPRGRRGSGRGRTEKSCAAQKNFRIFFLDFLKIERRDLRYPWSYPGPPRRSRRSVWYHRETGAGTGQGSRPCHNRGRSSCWHSCSRNSRWYRCSPAAYRRCCSPRMRRARWSDRGLALVLFRDHRHHQNCRLSALSGHPCTHPHTGRLLSGIIQVKKSDFSFFIFLCFVYRNRSSLRTRDTDRDSKTANIAMGKQRTGWQVFAGIRIDYTHWCTGLDYTVF
jgi:hypothetical protein